ncbi:MAG: hypothetical protein ACOCTM_03720 [Bacteroidota bacterium]
MHTTMRWLRFPIMFLSVLGIIMLFSCKKKLSETTENQGVYGNPKPLWDKGYNLSDLGVNAIFVHRGSINREMIDRARRRKG